MRQLKRLVLASSSPRRVELLAGLGLTFDRIPSHLDESFEGQPDPERLVLDLSEAKAREVCRTLPPGDATPTLVVGADTIVVLEGEILNKPGSRGEAIEMLRKLSGRCHTVFTGVAVVSLPEHRLFSGYRASRVYFRPMEDPEIEAYVDTGEPDDKAGAYALQGTGSAFVEKVDGCFTNIIGLPVPLTVDLLRQAGLIILGLPK